MEKLFTKWVQVCYRGTEQAREVGKCRIVAPIWQFFLNRWRIDIPIQEGTNSYFMPSSYLCNCYLQRLSFDDLFIKNVTWKFVIPKLKSFVWCNNWTETEWGSPQNQLTEISRICNFMQISLHWSNSLSLQVEQNYLMRSFWWWPMNQLGTFFTTATCHKILLVIITSCL